MRVPTLAALATAMAVSAASVSAQPTAWYHENFQEYAVRQAVPGWIESSFVGPATRRRAVSTPDGRVPYATAPDPADARNTVFGVANAVGTAATWTGADFTDRFTFTGRIYRERATTRAGIIFHSNYRLDASTMTLLGPDGSAFEGSTVGGVDPAGGVWNRFRIEVEEVAASTVIRARMWRDGTPEPAIFPITAVNTALSRPLGGRIGLWATGGGAAWFDDLDAQSIALPQAKGPVIAIVTPPAGTLLDTARVAVTGRVDGATSVLVNGVPADIDVSAKTFEAGSVTLAEGPSTLTAVARDADGKVAEASVNVIVDTRAPDLVITAPAMRACLNAAAIEVRGRVFDPALENVSVIFGESSTTASVSDGEWNATIPAEEGTHAFRVEAKDTLGHLSAATIQVTIDRTSPAIEISESGRAFAVAIVNRPIALFSSVRDASAVTTVSLFDRQPYAAGTAITAEGDHELSVTATDCAGNRSEQSVRFTIDRTPPQLLSIVPPNDATVGAEPQITGTVSADAVRVVVEPQGASFPVTNGGFTLDTLNLAEGPHEIAIVVFDSAGNERRIPYKVTVRLAVPVLEIVENGAVIAPGSIFSRPVAPLVRSSDPAATITTTLNGQAFVVGTTIGADGSYTLSASAIDALGHRSESVSVTFSIDTTPPVITILSPAEGTVFHAEDAEAAEVRGTVSADTELLMVNGLAPAREGAAFVVRVPLEFGTNLIRASARDAAGNTASVHVEVERGMPPAIVLTAPRDGMITNRRTAVVAGQVFAPETLTVTVAGREAPTDLTGAFRVTNVDLAEGENVITASVRASTGVINQASVRVIADRTPPHVRILESGQPVQNNARFATSATLTVDAAATVTELIVDGAIVAKPVTITSAGGHSVIATARDAAGNESRLERFIIIGTAAGNACALDGFDPADGAIVTSSHVVLTGRSGGASAVRVNGVPATVANGSFCALVELGAEGANNVKIECDGGAAATIVLRRVTGDPSIEMVTPVESAVTANEVLVVTGTASADVTSVDVNGVAASVAAGSWQASVRLAAGLNIVLARARNAGRASVASRRVVFARDAPSIAITSPPTSFTTGAAQIDISGMWQNIDPSTISAASTTPSVTKWSDTSGTFTIPVDLRTGENTITITGRDVLGRPANASVTVTRMAGPAISITSPTDNAFRASAAGEGITIEGTFAAAPGAIVEVNGTPATHSGSQFSAVVTLTSAGIIPIVARVTEPSGAAAIDAIRIHRLAHPLAVVEQFPPAGATEIGRGALPLILFSSPVDRASLESALRLETSNGSTVAGTLRLDRDVATFAPATLLAPGERYTLRVTTAAKDLAGGSLASELSTPFTVAAGAGSAAPTLGNLPTRLCADSIEITGTAPAGSRLRIDLGNLRFTTTAASNGSFSYRIPRGGRTGHQAVRVRFVGSDGSESAAAEACFLVDCGGLRVVSSAFDRNTNRLTVLFSDELSPASPDAFALRTPDGRSIALTVTVQSPATSVIITPGEDLTRSTFTLTISPALAVYTEIFRYEPDTPPASGDGSGFVSGEVFDAQSGWPLGNASVQIDSVALTTDVRGRYTAVVPEGAHTIRVAAEAYVTVWRQIVVQPGAGVIPIDVRLAREETGGVTRLDAQTLPGLLPLGWSALAAATTRVTDPLRFQVPAQEIIDASQTLSAVQYRDDRDEWRVVAAVVNVASTGEVTLPITEPGSYALVYADRAPHLVRPPPAVTGAALEGVVDPCSDRPCPPLVSTRFTLEPPAVLPTGHTVVTVVIDGADPARFPSGFAVQASIDEELKLADGSRIAAPPFTTDLILQRTLRGDAATAQFRLAPSERAATVVLEVGFSRIRILPYPGRLDRGSLIGAEGGRVPGDGTVTVDLPAGAAVEPVRASTAAIETSSLGTINGFEIIRGFELSLQRTDDSAPVELLHPARITLATASTTKQHVLVEIVDPTPHGRIYRLAAVMAPLSGNRVTTEAIDRSVLPLDGVIREGRYLLLAATNPIAFAMGAVRGPSAAFVRDAKITTTLGVAGLTAFNGVFALPVPAATFTLVPRTVMTGDGAPYIHAGVPAQGSVVSIGELHLILQPPSLTSVFPARGAGNVPLTTTVKAIFAPAIDPASVTSDAIVVYDATMQRVAGAVAAEGATGVVWSLPAGERLKPNSLYTAHIAPSIRAPNGTPFGRSEIFTFTTVTEVINGEVRPERVRITIPDANHRSRIFGIAGALPSSWLAIAVRRGSDFVTKPQGTAGNDGSFGFTIGENVALSDLIDLQVINAAGAIAAIVPLAPFVTDDAAGFVAAADRDTKFLAPDGTKITVPKDAFDSAVLVSTAPAKKETFLEIPQFDEELQYTTSIRVDFDGVAAKRLDVELPVPPGTATEGRQFLLGVLGQSVRGPRMMIVDTLRIENGKFTTAAAPAPAGARVGTNSVLPPDRIKDYLNGVNRSGTFGVVDIKAIAPGGLAWAVIDGIAGHADVFWDHLDSLFAAAYYVADRGRIAIPVQAGKRFEVVGVDASTGLQAFSKVYDPLPASDPGAAHLVPTPNADTNGPYPVSGGPFRIEVVDVHTADVNITSVENLVIRLGGGTITATDSANPLPADVNVSMMNTTRGGFDASRKGGLAVAGEPGDRVILMIEERSVGPGAGITLVFSEPIYPGPDLTAPGIDSYLHSVVRVERLHDPRSAAAVWRDISLDASFRLDSGNRRLLVDLPSLERGASYRIALLPDLADASGAQGGPGLLIGQAVVGAQTSSRLNEPVYLPFQVRAPGGLLSSFDIGAGAVRDQSLNGNILFVAAHDGGVIAFDAADPAGMATGMQSLGIVQPGPTQFWSVASDRHGRIFATGVTSVTGLLQTFRLEDFIDRGRPAPRSVTPKSGAFVSWTPGSSGTIGGGLTGLIASDRPEGIPRKVQVLLQDDDRVHASRAAFIGATGASRTTVDPLFDQLTVSIPMQATHAYATQRITIENVSLDLRWSADATHASPAGFNEVLARAGDQLRVIYNQTTYAVIAIMGYGIAIYDVNAMESNDLATKPSGYKPLRELVRMTRAALRAPDPFAPNTCNLPGLDTQAIPDLTFTPEATVITRGTSPALEVFALDPRRGVLDLSITPPLDQAAGSLPPDQYTCDRAPYGLPFRNVYQSGTYDHPRLVQLRQKFEAVHRRAPSARFNQLSLYSWRLEAADNRVVAPPVQPQGLPIGARGSAAGTAVERNYVLVAGHEYGLLVIEAGGTTPANIPPYDWLNEVHLVDVIWVPHGVAAVRAIPRTNLATIIDGEGYALLVDLSQIDERFDRDGKLRPANELFPSAARAVAGTELDPRVVWRSPATVGFGTLAPVIDPETGILYIGQLTQRTMSVLAAIDPRIHMKADLGASDGLSEVGGVVPLGIEPPQSIQKVIASAPAARRADASLAAFRFEVTLPGAVVEKLTKSGNRLQLAVESERVANAPVEQLAAPYPRSHLRLRGRDGSADRRPPKNFHLDRVVPATMAARNRHQSGFNKFVSPWIVAIADPRASIEYEWPKNATHLDKAAAGCFSCDRPDHLKGKTEAEGVWEMVSAGRVIAARPDFCASNCASTLFSGTRYAYLGDEDRMVARFATIIADTVRPPQVLVAAQNPPVAVGAIQETTFLHSGEMETTHIDLDAGGRAGWNVVADRSYRSRSIGLGAFGSGWESSMFRRLRPLPIGDVEYRDGAGEIWQFRLLANGSYLSPRGLFLRLTRTDRGWRMVDSKSRVSDFDGLGRLVTESDQFADDPAKSGRGNIIRYLYGGDGRLAEIIDPVGRPVRLRYYSDSEPGLKAGRLWEIEDWRNRIVRYDYDPDGRLIEVALPDVVNTNGVRPAIRYSYEANAGTFNDRLELKTNLRSITDPAERDPRVTFVYDTADHRDRIVAEQWTATGESVTFAYPPASPVESTDALGQKRFYTLTAQPGNFHDDRGHVASMVESDIETSKFQVGLIPVSGGPKDPPRQKTSRSFEFAYDPYGLLIRSRLAGVRATTYKYADVPSAPGRVLVSTITEGEGGVPGAPIEKKIAYQPGTAFVESVEAGGIRIESSEAHRATAAVMVTNDDVAVRRTLDDAGRVTEESTSGGIDPGASQGSLTNFDYFLDDGPMHKRGLLRRVLRPGLLPARNDYEIDAVTHTDERNVQTRTALDTWLRAREVVTTGPGLTFKESSDYDASGRLRVHRREQDALTVTTRYDYDPLGRIKGVTTDNVAVRGMMTTSTEATRYNLSARTVERTLPSGAVVTEILDTLGRVLTRKTVTGHTVLTEEYVYDLAGNLVWRSDDHTVAASAFDAHGRAIETVAADGTKTKTEFDAWSRPKKIDTTTGNGTLTGSSEMEFSAAGRIRASRTLVDGGVTREMTAVWDGAGRQTGVAVEGRAARSEFDVAGRLVGSVSGGGTALTIMNEVQRLEVIAPHDGMLVTATSLAEGNRSPVLSTFRHDTAGNVTEQLVGNLKWEQRYDQAGNLKTVALPERSASAYEHDGRGATTAEIKPGGNAVIAHQYDASGAPAAYRDPVNELTETINDDLGRPRSRIYADGTSETFEYDGQRLLSARDRQGRVSTYTYTAAGQVAEVRGAGGARLDRFTYDDAGRMIRRETPDAVLTWENFDLEGRPKKTTQSRIDPGGAVIDSYVQEHQWNVHGERSSSTMPAYPGYPGAPGWTRRVDEHYDDAGNVVRIERDGAVLLDAIYRNAGHPERRSVMTAGPAPLVREYGYNASGQLSSMRVTANGLTIGGSELAFDGLQVSEATLLGLSAGDRAHQWGYDEHGRLMSSSYGRDRGAPAPAIENLSPADDRVSQDRPAAKPGDPPSTTFASAPGHKLREAVRGTDVRAFAYGGAERIDDGRFAYEYDARGRMIRATEKGAGRRIHYFYSGSNRVVGRRAEYGPPYKLEDRPAILAEDGIPPDVTYVWDPVTDRIAAIYKTGSSQNATIDANGGLVRQILHGGLGYDDPIEVAYVSGSSGKVDRMYPVFDEPAAGGLQLIANEAGQVVSRQISQDPYGGEESALAGAGVDRIVVTAAKSDTGALELVHVDVRLTEEIAADTLAQGGARISGTVATPTLANPFTIRWKFTPAEWTVLPSLTIQITDQLRAAAWSEATPILPPPDWALASKPVATSADIPFEYRESATSLATWLATVGAGESRSTTLYEVENLAALARRSAGNLTRLMVASTFQALPFTEAATGLVYARSRWIDSRSGSFLTPDPIGYRDSSNLYAFCGGDPINCRDPEGRAGYFFDGTWNDKDVMANKTNVAKLFLAYSGSAHYIPGVGTSRQIWGDKFVGGGFGGGARAKLGEMYEKLTKWYNEGDRQIDIFGFSRGGALAIAFANMIQKKGIPDLSSARKLSYLDDQGIRRDRIVYSRYFQSPNINFVGVFDVVGSFGIPGNRQNVGFDLGRPSRTANIRHATANDEKRFFFPLTSMLDAPGRGPASVREVAFPGAHSDVGGGYEDIDTLARAPLNWMWQEAVQSGVPLQGLRPEDRRIDPDAPAHYSSSAFEEYLDIQYRQLGWRYVRKVYYQGH